MVYSEKVCGVYKQVAYGEEYIMWCIVRKCVVCMSKWCKVRNTLCGV